MELIKHFTQSRVEPNAPTSPIHTTVPQPPSLPPHLIEGSGNEPRIYSVRKLLESLPPEAMPPASIDGATPAAEAVGEAASGSPADLARAVLSYVESGGSADYQVFQAVARLFDQTQGARAQLNQLGTMFDSIESLAQTVASTFVPLDAFRQQLEQLARSFAPIKALRREMARIALTCEAIKPLQEQFTQLAGGFKLHIGALIKALEPAEEVRLRIVQLAEAFEPLATLHERLAELQGSFDGDMDGSSEQANGTSGDGVSGSAVTFFVAKSA